MSGEAARLAKDAAWYAFMCATCWYSGWMAGVQAGARWILRSIFEAALR
jgi:hypothetical protein